MVKHSSTRATLLCDRFGDDNTLNEVERTLIYNGFHFSSRPRKFLLDAFRMVSCKVSGGCKVPGS